MVKLTAITRVMLGFPLLVMAAAPTPVSKPKTVNATAAINKHDRAADAAEAAYKHAVLDAKRELLTELEAVAKQMAKTGNLAEVSAIQARIVRTEAEMKRIKAGTDTFVVEANANWVATVALAQGQRCDVVAAGRWAAISAIPPKQMHGPDGRMFKGKRAQHLEGRFGEDGGPFFVGTKASLEADRDGALYLRMNDTDHGDNVGKLTVTIRARMTATPPVNPAARLTRPG